MTSDEPTTPFVPRLRDQLIEGLPRYRSRRRQRRRVALATAGVLAVATTAALVGATGGTGDGATTDPTTDVATQNGPPDPSLDPRHDAEILVADFVQDLRDGRSEDAAELWSGYPGRGDLESRVAGVDDLRDRLPWLADRTFDELTVNAPIWPGQLLPVTVTASTGPDQPVSAAAFMVDTGDGEPPIIERLASPAPGSTPPSGTPVAPGQDIRVPVTTPELVGSDVVAWFGGASVLASDVAAGQVTVPVSERRTRPIVLTVMVPTAEVPVAWAFWFPVAER